LPSIFMVFVASGEPSFGGSLAGAARVFQRG
jgi:hypothetical protein